MKPKLLILWNPVAPWAQQLVNRLATDFEIIDAGSDIRKDHSLGLRGAITLRKLIQESKPDVLLALYGGKFALQAYLSGFRPYIVYAVGCDVAGLTGLKRLVARLALSKAAAVPVNGEWLRGAASRLAGHDDTVTIRHGIDLVMFPFNKTPRREKRLLVTRAYAPVYNQEAIINAMAANPVPSTTITFADGSAGWESFRDQLLTVAPHWSKHVAFLGGVLHKDMPALMQTHSHYLSMARRDGIATSLLEAMASGLSPILSDTPANRETVGSGYATWVPIDNVEALSRQLANPHTFEPRELRRNRQIVETQADATNGATSLENLIRQHLKP